MRRIEVNGYVFYTGENGREKISEHLRIRQNREFVTKHKGLYEKALRAYEEDKLKISNE